MNILQFGGTSPIIKPFYARSVVPADSANFQLGRSVPGTVMKFMASSRVLMVTHLPLGIELNGALLPKFLEFGT